jgi:hypothetical protein
MEERIKIGDPKALLQHLAVRSPQLGRVGFIFRICGSEPLNHFVELYNCRARDAVTPGTKKTARS